MPKFLVPKRRMLAVVALAALSIGVPFTVAQQPASQPSTTQPFAPQPAAPGQQPAAPTQKSGDQKPDDSQQSTETLKINVNVVQLFFNVKDKHGALIPNLTKDDFTIFEDGQQQTLKYFTPETNLPLTLGILIDSSGSQLRVLDMEKEVGGAFLKQVLTDKDLAYVIDFNVDASLVQDFTRDVHLLQKALNSVKINSGVTMPTLPGAGGGPVPTAASPGTVLYDAVYLSAHDMLAKEVGRKAMILLTDGEDEGSRLKIQRRDRSSAESGLNRLRAAVCRPRILRKLWGWAMVARARCANSPNRPAAA